MDAHEMYSDLFQMAGCQLPASPNNRGSAPDKYALFEPVDCIAPSNRFAKKSKVSRVSPLLIQLSMEFEKKVVRFVPKNRIHVLNHHITNLFIPGNRRFTRVALKLRAADIVQLGDLIQMSEEEFRGYTSSESIVEYTKTRLNELGFGFDFETPGWTPRVSDW